MEFSILSMPYSPSMQKRRRRQQYHHRFLAQRPLRDGERQQGEAGALEEEGFADRNRAAGFAGSADEIQGKVVVTVAEQDVDRQAGDGGGRGDDFPAGGGERGKKIARRVERFRNVVAG